MARVFLMVVLAIGASVASAQQQDCALQVDTTTLEPGEALDIRLVCTNTGQPGVPETAVPDGLDLRLVNSVPSTFSQTTMINGRTTQSTSYTYAMRLTALVSGSYVLGPVSVTAGGKTYKTQPVTFTVRESESASVPLGDRYLFAEIEVTPTSLYVTETFQATLTVGIRKVVINDRTVELNLLNQIGGGSSLSVFAGERARPSERTIRDSQGVAHRYEIYRVIKTIRAETVGQQQIGPVFLRMEYPTSVRRGFFRDYEVHRARPETARAPAVTVDVKGAPEEGRPPSFTGAIGQFTMTVSAKPARVEQGQPVTLSISIGGEAAAGVAGPDLHENPQLVSRFDFSKDELVGDMEGAAKVFRRAIFPKEQGEQTIGPIRWSYFDTQREQYVTLTSDPIHLVVDPPSDTTLLAFDSEDQLEAAGTKLKVLTGGISPNYVDTERVLAEASFTLTPPWMAALLVPPMACLLTGVTRRHRARLRADAGYARRRRARADAEAAIQRAMSNGQAGAQVQAVSAALVGYLADRFNLPPGECTPGDVRAVLTNRAFEPRFVDEIVSLLERCEAARYAPSTLEGLSGGQIAENVQRWIRSFEKDKR